ncbi:hypothetical protein ACF0H5_014071 [Mactra antiquata]
MKMMMLVQQYADRDAASYKCYKLAEDDTDWNPWGEEFENEQLVISHHEPPKILWNLEHTETKHISAKGNNSNRIYNVEVWGKAAIDKEGGTSGKHFR